MMEFGKGEAFRHAGLLERAAAAFRAPLAGSPLKRPLKRAYEAVLDRLAGSRLVARFPHGESVRLAAPFRHVMWNGQEYEAFRREIAPGDFVLDVGANLGAYTLLFGQWVGPTGRVVAFEPAPEPRQGLERHVALNALADRIVVRAEAMSAAKGTARFGGTGPNGHDRLTKTTEGSVEVPTTSIDAFCEETNRLPRFIKVDVEGAELDVLKGARKTIRAAGPGLKLFVEMHPELWPALGTSREAMEAELALQHLRPERLDGSPDIWTIEGVCLRLRPCGS